MAIEPSPSNHLAAHAAPDSGWRENVREPGGENVGSIVQMLDGWKASPNPFDSLDPAAHASSAPEGFAESITAIRLAAQDACQRGNWGLAAEQLNAAVWMSSAINDYDTCIQLARLLVACQLAASQFRDARVLAEQMLICAHAANDRALLHALTTVICLCDCAQMAVGPVLRSNALVDFARLMDPAVIALLRAGTFSQWLHDDVAALLAQYGNPHERAAWRYAWTALVLRFQRMPESLPLIRMLPV